MVDDSALRKYGVKHLEKSPSGRAYLQQLREKHKLDILQPNDPMYKQVYGKVIAEREAKKKSNEEVSAAMRERMEWEKRQKAGQGTDWKSKRL